MSKFRHSEKFFTTCDVCGHESCQDIDEIPEGWLVTIEGGPGSKIWAIETAIYGYPDGAHPVRTLVDEPHASGKVAKIICSKCLSKLLKGIGPMEDV